MAFIRQLSALSSRIRIHIPFHPFPLRRAGIALALLLSACATVEKAPPPPVSPVPAAPVQAAPAAPAAVTPAAPHEIRFAIAGDIMAHASQLAAAYDKKCDCYDFKPVFAAAAPLFKGVDVALANFETTLPGKNYSGYPQFGAPDALVDAIKSAGINLVTTANNHALDKGKDGVIRTLKVLDEKGIPHLGTYASEADYEKQRVFLLTKNGITVAMLDYTYGTNGIPTPDDVVVNRISKAQISADIALARTKHPDAIIVLFHFGREYLNKPDAYQREVVLHALASGADIVLGGHPHQVQPYELLHNGEPDKSRLVAYSLGNFVSGQRQRYTDGGMVLYFTLAKKQNAAGKPVIDITDVHHKLVWVYLAREDDRKDFRILPIEASLASAAELNLPQSAVESMKRYRADAEKVLGIKEGELRK